MTHNLLSTTITTGPEITTATTLTFAPITATPTTTTTAITTNTLTATVSATATTIYHCNYYYYDCNNNCRSNSDPTIATPTAKVALTDPFAVSSVLKFCLREVNSFVKYHLTAMQTFDCLDIGTFSMIGAIAESLSLEDESSIVWICVCCYLQ